MLSCSPTPPVSHCPNPEDLSSNPLPPGNSRGTLGKCKKLQQIICLKPLYGELPKICDWIRKYVQIYHNFITFLNCLNFFFFFFTFFFFFFFTFFLLFLCDFFDFFLKLVFNFFTCFTFLTFFKLLLYFILLFLYFF